MRQVIECWHLTAEEHSLLATDCLLPLARMQAADVMEAPSIKPLPQHQQQQQQPSSAQGSPEQLPLQLQPGTAATASARWSAPQLSQLVDRLQSHDAALPSHPKTPPSAKLRRGSSRLAKMGSMTQQDASLSSGASGDGQERTIGLPGEQYIAAAVPAHVLLASLTARARTVLTADPLPFANAESPLRDHESSPLQKSSRQRQAAADEAGSDVDADSVAGSEGQQGEAKQDSPDLMERAKSVASRLKIQRKGKKPQSRKRLLRGETADVQTIQAHLAALIKVHQPVPIISSQHHNLLAAAKIALKCYLEEGM